MKSFGSSTVRCSCTAPCRPSTAACAAGSVCHLSCATSHGNGFATCPRNQWKWQSHGGGTCKTKGPVMWIGNNANNSWTSRKRWKNHLHPQKMLEILEMLWNAVIASLEYFATGMARGKPGQRPIPSIIEIFLKIDGLPQHSGSGRKRNHLCNPCVRGQKKSCQHCAVMPTGLQDR